MPGPFKLNIKVWPSWTLSGRSGREPTSEPIQVLASSVPVVAGLRASVLADCWPGLLSAPADISLERSLLDPPFPHPSDSLLPLTGENSLLLWGPVVMLDLILYYHPKVSNAMLHHHRRDS